MFTSKNFKILALVTNLAWLSGAVPYHFLKGLNGESKLIYSPTKERRAFVKISFSLNLVYSSFIAFRVLQKALVENGEAEAASLSFLVKMGYLFASYTLPVVLQLNTLLKWEETPRFLSQYIKFFKDVQAKYLLPSEKTAKCMKFFVTVMLIGIAVCIQNTVIIMKKPFQEHFLTSILDNPKSKSILIRLPFLLCNMWVWANTWTNIWVFCFHQYLYITCGVFVMKELDVYVKHPKTSRRFRDTKTCAGILRSVQVLHRNWQLNFQEWFCPSHKAAVITIATLALYGVIKLSGPRAIIMGFVALLALLYLSTLFYKFGQFNEMSAITLENWRNHPKTTKWMKKFIKSVPIFSIGIGKFYYIKKTTVIMVMYTVLNNTITLFFL